jgi:hypothetical protein
LNQGNESKLRICERRILRKICGPANEDGYWQIRYNFELCLLYDKPGMIKVLKIESSRIIGRSSRRWLKQHQIISTDSWNPWMEGKNAGLDRNQ